MSWDYYEDFHGIAETPPEPKKPDITNLVLIGLGLFAGYLFFSEDKETVAPQKELPKPVDNLDKAIVNKIFHKSNPIEVESIPVVENKNVEIIAQEPLEVKTLDDLKNWGRQARNIYGRSVLPLMKDEHGNPTQIAMDATALGCEIPKNKKQAKEIARRGTEALRKYKELKKSGIKKNDAVEFKV